MEQIGTRWDTSTVVERIGSPGCLTVADVGITTEYGWGAVRGIW